MSQIEITVLKQGIQTGYVLSCSLFKMQQSYRDFSRYETNFKRFLVESKNLKNFETRVYVDDTTKDIVMQLTASRPDVSVYHFNCPQFREGNGHTGVFGMIPRFLPLFEEGLNAVWISDVDLLPNFLNPNILTSMKRTQSDVFINTVVCSQRKPWLNVKHPIIAYRFISFITFPKQLLTRFLNKVSDGDFNDLISEINTYNSRKSSQDIFPYGLDEFFINTSIYKSIKRRDVQVFLYKDYFVQNMLVYNIPNFPVSHAETLSRFYRSPTPELFKRVKEIYKRYLPEIVEEYPCVQEVLDELDTFKTSFLKIQTLPSSNL